MKQMINGVLIDHNDKDSEQGISFYRCVLCGGIVNKWDIKESQGCPKCANPRLKPTNLSLWEKFIQICKHPKVWAWNAK